jgi:hypothetical protein
MRHQIVITLDSLRWDVFNEARIPFLRSLGAWKKGFTQGTYTFPAHMSFFMGKLPQTTDHTPFYDTVAHRVNGAGLLPRQLQYFRLENPEAARPGAVALTGRNIVEGYRRRGYATIGSGGVSWFNPEQLAGRYLTEHFEHFAFFGGPQHGSHASARRQIDWALWTLQNQTRPCFLFLNFGETHHRFVHEGCAWFDEPFEYGDAGECRRRQRACLEYLDGQIARLFEHLHDYDLVICSDHGEAFGEDGLWEHGFYHPVIMEVPILIRAEAASPPGI